MITVILNAYKRLEHLETQIKAIKNQSIKSIRDNYLAKWNY